MMQPEMENIRPYLAKFKQNREGLRFSQPASFHSNLMTASCFPSLDTSLANVTSYDSNHQHSFDKKYLPNLSSDSKKLSGSCAMASPNKLIFRYEKDSQRFKLVEKDLNKPQTASITKQINENNDLIVTLNNLCQRVEKLQKNSKFIEQQHNFNIRATVEKIIDSKYSSDVLRREITQKKLEQAVIEIRELKEKVGSISPSSLQIDTQKRMPKNFRFFQEQSPLTGSKIRADVRQKCQKSEWKAQLLEKIAKLDTKMSQHTQNIHKSLQQKIQEISRLVQEKEIQHKSKFTNSIVKQVENRNNQSWVKSQSDIIARMIVEVIGKAYHTCTRGGGSIVTEKKDVLMYGVDKDGCILDQQGYYLTDSRGFPLKLTSTQVTQLIGMGIVGKQ